MDHYIALAGGAEDMVRATVNYSLGMRILKVLPVPNVKVKT